MQRVNRQDSGPASGSYSIAWEFPGGFAGSAEVRAVDISSYGMRVECGEEIAPGTQVYIHGSDLPGRHAVVRHCTPFGERFYIGLDFGEETCAAQDADYYELLQINPKAEMVDQTGRPLPLSRGESLRELL